MEFGVIALAIMAAFAGLTLSIVWIVHPASRELLDGDMVAQWKRQDLRTRRLQALLPLTAAFFGVLAAMWAGRALSLTGALFALCIWVVSFRWGRPLLRKLGEVDPETADAGTRLLLEKWQMHQLMLLGLAVLSILSFFASLP